MDKEMEALIKVSAITSALMAYTRFARIPPGPCRLLALLPVTASLILLPFSFSSLHLRGISAFFLAWLSVFKLLLLSFAAGPLSPTLPFLTFLPVATLPVKIRRPRPSSDVHRKPSYLLSSAAKALIFSILLSLYPHRDKFPFHLLLALYCCHIYLSLDLILAAAAFFSGSIFGLDLEPQFNAPYRSISLQDFWGRRWNLMVTAILRPSVYGPVRARWGTSAGVMATFAVSGLMHELMFYYITSAPPTGEVSCFFVLHGVCTAAEVWVKGKGSGEGCGRGWSRRLNTTAAVVTTLGFVAGTGFCLFFPPLLRNGADERALKECAAVIGLLEGGSRTARGWFGL